MKGGKQAAFAVLSSGLRHVTRASTAKSSSARPCPPPRPRPPCAHSAPSSSHSPSRLSSGAPMRVGLAGQPECKRSANGCSFWAARGQLPSSSAVNTLSSNRACLVSRTQRNRACYSVAVCTAWRQAFHRRSQAGRGRRRRQRVRQPPPRRPQCHWQGSQLHERRGHVSSQEHAERRCAIRQARNSVPHSVLTRVSLLH